MVCTPHLIASCALASLSCSARAFAAVSRSDFAASTATSLSHATSAVAARESSTSAFAAASSASRAATRRCKDAALATAAAAASVAYAWAAFAVAEPRLGRRGLDALAEAERASDCLVCCRRRNGTDCESSSLSSSSPIDTAAELRRVVAVAAATLARSCDAARASCSPRFSACERIWMLFDTTQKIHREKLGAAYL
jgi:flagellar hook-length control protein FliK